MEAKYQELIKLASESDQEELKILSAAVEKTREAYTGLPTAGNKKDWDAAKNGLGDLVDLLWVKHFPGAERFDNLLAVLKYLQGKGYKVRKSKLYQDRKKGHISVQADGTVLKKDAERYAKTLNQLASSEAAADAVQHEKMSRESERLEKQVALLQIELDQKNGKLQLREDAAFERASNIAVIIASLNQLAEMECGDLVDIVLNSEPSQRRPNFVKALTDRFEVMFNRLVQAETYQLSIDEGHY